LGDDLSHERVKRRITSQLVEIRIHVKPGDVKACAFFECSLEVLGGRRFITEAEMQDGKGVSGDVATLCPPHVYEATA
jgi:hypothetical protein